MVFKSGKFPRKFILFDVLKLIELPNKNYVTQSLLATQKTSKGGGGGGGSRLLLPPPPLRTQQFRVSFSLTCRTVHLLPRAVRSMHENVRHALLFRGSLLPKYLAQFNICLANISQK